MKKKYKLRKWVKIVISAIIIIIGVVIYHYLAKLGAYASENTMSSIFICLGWFWLVFGQISMLYAIWEI